MDKIKVAIGVGVVALAIVLIGLQCGKKPEEKPVNVDFEVGGEEEGQPHLRTQMKTNDKGGYMIKVDFDRGE